MQKNRTFKHFVIKCIEALNEAKIDYVLIGGIVVSIYGRPRSTLDVDIIIEKNIEKIDVLERELRKKSFIVPENELKEAIQEGTQGSIFGKETILRLDIKTPTRILEEEALKHRKSISLFGKETFIQIPEEIIVAKLLYGSDQDIEDALSIFVRMKEKIDHKLLEKLAKRENVKHELDRIKNHEIS